MRVAIVPGVPALRPEYASIEDPVPELRAAVAEATRWLGSGRLVVANGSAKRTEKAPGYFDDRAAAFDEALGAALRAGDLAGLDLSLAGELWADVAGLTALAGVRATEVQVDYDDAPYGVQYWVVRWQCTP
ncbi:MAG: hypothetical protein JWQ32_2982 [Marmoricola sp.]|nr:hypothetical protein [Marmoricola sp.]